MSGIVAASSAIAPRIAWRATGTEPRPQAEAATVEQVSRTADGGQRSKHHTAPYLGPSAPFLAQRIAQASAADRRGDLGEHEPGRIAYRLASERDITYLGLQGPFEVVV